MRPDIIIQMLTQAGFEAYYVGGCVRDTLLLRSVHDWDIATSALPEQVTALFAHTVPTGIRHGTVTVLEGGFSCEVTTYRLDGAYLDARRPESVRFVGDLREDLARRDFTVNAMAMDTEGSVTDLFGGREDLSRRLIRCVGDPDRRFGEDALRMLRAVRFSAQLGFSIEPETYAAILRCRDACRKLSRERVRDEAEKTLLSEDPARFGELMKLGLLAVCGLEGEADFSRLSRVPCQPAARWAAAKLCAPELDPAQFRLPSALSRLIDTCAESWQEGRSTLDWKRLIAAQGWQAAELQAAMQGSDEVERIRRSGACVRLDALSVNGDDFPQYRGREVGKLLHALLAHVLEHPEDNTRTRLLALAERMDLEKTANSC